MLIILQTEATNLPAEVVWTTKQTGVNAFLFNQLLNPTTKLAKTNQEFLNSLILQWSCQLAY